jgi:predicted amidohydrolase
VGRQKSKARLEVRQAEIADAAAIVELIDRCYTDISGYSPGEIRAQINNFPKAASSPCSTSGSSAIARRCGCRSGWHCARTAGDEITGNGFGSPPRPDRRLALRLRNVRRPEGPRHRIGRRLYEERRALAEQLELSGIAFGGRMPNSRARGARWKARRLSRAGEAGKIARPGAALPARERVQARGRPQELSARGLRNRRQCRADGLAQSLCRKRPAEGNRAAARRRERPLATCQLQARAVANFDEFLSNVEYFVDVAADYESDFIVFPEMFTLSCCPTRKKELSPLEAIEKLSDLHAEDPQALSEMAMRFNINIIGGSHPTGPTTATSRTSPSSAFATERSTSRRKIHPTPNERYWWNIKGGDDRRDPDRLRADRRADLLRQRIPELARRLADQGARISSCRSAPTAARAICGCATAARRGRSRTSASW